MAVGRWHRTAEETSRHERESSISEGRPAFPVALWKFSEGCTSALVYRCTKECSVSQLNLLALELTQALLFVCSLFFFSHSLDCISCAVKKCVIPQSEPQDDSPAKIEIVSKKLMYGGGMVTRSFIFVLVKVKRNTLPQGRGWNPWLTKPLYSGLIGWPIKK